MPIKTRSSRTSSVSGRKRSSIFAAWAPYEVLGFLSNETSVTIDHAWLGNRWAGGGPWYLSRDAYSIYPSYLVRNSLNFEGTLRMSLPLSAVTPLPLPHIPSDGEMDAMGTSAIASTEPTRPAFDLSVFLGEWRSDGMPRLPGLEMKESVAKARSAGSEFLNYEFGWLPLVSDVRTFAKAVNNSDAILRKYQEEANIVIKRSRRWPSVGDSKFNSVGFSSSPAELQFLGGGRFQTVLQDKWFEADYVYHLPTGTSVNDKFRRYGSYARKLLGVRMTPEVLWNLAPWSWAVDWFSNVGDVVHNVSAMGTDGLVIRNAYMMCHTVRTTRDYGVSPAGAATIVRVEESKLRRSSGPYGFGTSGIANLTTRQRAIVAALGLSRHYG